MQDFFSLLSGVELHFKDLTVSLGGEPLISGIGTKTAIDLC